MDKEKLANILSRLEKGEINLAQAFSEAGNVSTISDLGFARLDLERHSRCGFPEFVYGQGKNKEQLTTIIREIRKNNQPVLASRLEPEIGSYLVRQFPEATYHETPRILVINDKEPENGNILIVTAGTTDLPVALEAKLTAEVCNCRAELIADSGVAGIHRLLAVSGKLQQADVIIVVAGMEGALPSFVGGMVSCPVIAVPTSVGYGASLNGFTPLLGMLSSCANGITVVNIDNGFGAGCAAVRIINKIMQK